MQARVTVHVVGPVIRAPVRYTTPVRRARGTHIRIASEGRIVFDVRVDGACQLRSMSRPMRNRLEQVISRRSCGANEDPS